MANIISQTFESHFLWTISSLKHLLSTIFILFQEGSSEERKVKHFEMVGFNDEATDPGFILNVCRRVNNHVTATAGPILVHCRYYHIYIKMYCYLL
jgi:hypothetical protein